MKEDIIQTISNSFTSKSAATFSSRINKKIAEDIYNTLLEAGYVVKKEEPTKEQLHDAFTKGVNDALFKEPPQADLLEELEKYLDAEISIKLTGLTRLQTLVEIRSKIQELKAKP